MSFLKRIRISYIFRFWVLYVLSLLLAFVIFFGIAQGWFGSMPSFEELENPERNLASEVYSSDGYMLGTYYIENRSDVHFEDLPPYLVQALLATEDIRFYNHAGVDMKALGRVAYGLLSGNYRGGGSTLTQQLAKNLFPRGNLSKFQLVGRKLKEWVTAIKLEKNYSKEEIMAMYLNTVSYGHHAFGIKSAARTFFNKTVDSLSLPEAALLVGVVNAPTWYSPIRNPERAFDRRNLVLSQMLKYGFINDSIFDTISRTPIDMSNFNVQDHTSGMARYFREYLRSEMNDWCEHHYRPDGTPYNLYRDGLRIYTTIDSRMQGYAEEAVQEHLGEDLQPSFDEHWKGYTWAPFVFDKDVVEQEVAKLMDQAMRRSERYRKMSAAGIDTDSIEMAFETPREMEIFSWDGPIDTILSPMDSIRYYKHILQAGLLSIEPNTGAVKAYVGGIDYMYFKYDHATLSRRQVGSTFKPFLYTLAMQQGEFSPCYEVANIQYTVDLPTGEIWAPRNSSSDRVGEMVTLKWALANSNNWISAFLMRRYSPLSVIRMVRNMGVTSSIDPVPSIALGSCDLSLYEMVGAMNTFASKGMYVKPLFITRIEDKNGNVIESFVPERREAMSEETAFLMLELMKGVVESGTGIRLKFRYGFDNPIAGKTGTTQNQSDGWFMGIVPQLSTGVWVGCEDRSAHFRTITLGQGANMALPIWAIYMKKVYDDPELNYTKGDFERPLKELSVEVDCDKYTSEGESMLEVEEDVIEF
ncbi:MAG: transglycosylase domain-containing protein [Bacteroidales bacterium]|jgi:penicillin-binding protein 1A|nr:transglycosylase domain-containing protein [Bacteroidales bacterium]